MSATDLGNRAITVLVADSDDISRTSLTSLIEEIGFSVIQAVDGASAIKVVQEHPIDLIFFDSIMHPVSGFELARYIHGNGLNVPAILISDDHTSDHLQYASSLGIRRVLAKPVDPRRIESVITQILARATKKEHNPALPTLSGRPPLTPEAAMQHAIDIARRNTLGKFGGPFAAVVTNGQGHLVGEGVNLPTSRFDPIAHAEVMAIRKAVEYLQQPHLEGCIIYSTCKPTKISMALIESVGISQVYYGVDHTVFKASVTHRTAAPVLFSQLASDDVLTMLKDVGYA